MFRSLLSIYLKVPIYHMIHPMWHHCGAHTWMNCAPNHLLRIYPKVPVYHMIHPIWHHCGGHTWMNHAPQTKGKCRAGHCPVKLLRRASMVENYECNFSPFGCAVHGVKLVRASNYELRTLLNFATICHYKEALDAFHVACLQCQICTTNL